jgi:erythromycin esterase-like protein
VSQLSTTRRQRAVGTTYNTIDEEHSHYFEAQIAQQFDAVIHIDHTSPLAPLEIVKMVDLEKMEPVADFGV